MPQLYELNQKINDLLPKVAQRYGINIDIKSEYYIKNNGQIIPVIDTSKDRAEDFYDSYNKIVVCWGSETGVRAVVWDDQYNQKEQALWIPSIQSQQIRQILNALEETMGFIPFNSPLTNTRSKALCRNWLDGLTPLIDTNPDQVLEELLDELNQLLND